MAIRFLLPHITIFIIAYLKHMYTLSPQTDSISVISQRNGTSHAVPVLFLIFPAYIFVAIPMIGLWSYKNFRIPLACIVS